MVRADVQTERPYDAGELEMEQLEARFRELVELMYDTGVPLSVLEEKVCPYLAEDVVFVDPALRSRGHRYIRTGLRGFHCAFAFEFDIHQLAVRLNEDGRSGRTLVDGVMNLRSIPGYMYPLRTILVYDFVLVEGNEPRITRLEEMWSLGDMIANAPLGIGALYDGVFRRLSGYFFVSFFWLACKLQSGRVRPSRSI